MLDTFVTHLQIFGIGFGFGLAGPCFFLCTPIAVAYIAGTKKRLAEVIGDISIFLMGRLLAYGLLGFFAGLSGGLLRHFVNMRLSQFFKPLAGIISILLGIFILTNKSQGACACPTVRSKTYNFTGLFMLGLMIGASPCAPLLALLGQIALMSKSALDGMSYAMSFGLGTFFSGLVVIGAFSGALMWFPARIFKSKKSNLFLRIICALLLALFGLGLILSRGSQVSYTNM